jgi:hypothetical protein
MPASDAKFVLEISDKSGASYCDLIESEQPLPVPAVGDLVTVPKFKLEVVRRVFDYGTDGSVHVHLYCQEAKAV